MTRGRQIALSNAKLVSINPLAPFVGRWWLLDAGCNADELHIRPFRPFGCLLVTYDFDHLPFDFLPLGRLQFDCTPNDKCRYTECVYTHIQYPMGSQPERVSTPTLARVVGKSVTNTLRRRDCHSSTVLLRSFVNGPQLVRGIRQRGSTCWRPWSEALLFRVSVLVDSTTHLSTALVNSIELATLDGPVSLLRHWKYSRLFTEHDDGRVCSLEKTAKLSLTNRISLTD